jgi:hypothetical protein
VVVEQAGVLHRQHVRQAAGLAMPWATSMRKPSTPRSSQNRIVGLEVVEHLGVGEVQVGLLGAKMCRYHWPSSTRLHAGPPKTDGQLFGGSRRPAPAVAEQVAPARATPARPPAPASNHRAGAEVWLGTSRRHPDAQRVGLGQQRVELGEVAEDRLDVARVRDVVAVSAMGDG